MSRNKIPEASFMIPRYTRPEMATLWSDEHRYKVWMEVELLALEGMAEEGVVPKESAKIARANAKIDAGRIQQIEDEVKHDVIAFLTNLNESIGPESRHIHRGLTSNDLLDTAFGVILKDAGDLILSQLSALMRTIKERAHQYKYLVTIGRSHGIHAEPTTFGIKLASWYAELERNRSRLDQAIKAVSVGKIAGAVGTYASISPTVEEYVVASLGITAETVASQIVHRDRHAAFFTALALLGSSIERFCVEIRHLQRTEVGEVEEGFAVGQKGSSAMPHKKNPIATENLTGIARLLRGYAVSAMENVALWHERDISHSSVERMIAPDATSLAHYMVWRMNEIVKNLVVHEDIMRKNVDLTRGLVYSGTVLIALTDAGMSREDAYRVVQRHAHATSTDGGAFFKERLASDEAVLKFISREALEELFSSKRHLAHVDLIFSRVFS